jgi:hypothetical protein
MAFIFRAVCIRRATCLQGNFMGTFHPHTVVLPQDAGLHITPAFRQGKQRNEPKRQTRQGLGWGWTAICIAGCNGLVRPAKPTVTEPIEMRKNMGTTDRVVRTVIALVLIALIAAGQLTQTWAVVATIVAAVFLLTSAIGFCPAYWPFRISSRRR